MINRPPQPSRGAEQQAQAGKTKEVPIADVREQFNRKVPQTAEDRARSRAFIAGKIDMIRRDPNLTDAEKAAAISEFESKY